MIGSEQFATNELFISSRLPPGVTAEFDLGHIGPYKIFISYAFTEWPRSDLTGY